MLQVNVREARKRFKELLDLVSQGEEVVVTRRGKVVARLLSPETSENRLPDLEEFRSKLGKKGTSSAKLLREERDKR